jgi:GNAT superfamily N-acetyltransferase
VTATSSAHLTDGRQAVLRPLERGDRERLIAGFHRLSEESRYRRFFAPLHQLSDSSLDYLTDIDHRHHEAIIALDPRSDELVGVARYVRVDPKSDRAEAAVVVADDWQHVGLGRALLEGLVTRARTEGVCRFTALVQADNRRALELLSEIGPTTRSFEGDLVDLEIELPEGRLGAALTAAFRASAASVLGVRPLSERLARAARELWEARPGPRGD